MTDETTDAMEEGRRLASQRDDLIAQGVDPAELLVPVAPEGRVPLSNSESSGVEDAQTSVRPGAIRSDTPTPEAPTDLAAVLDVVEEQHDYPTETDEHRRGVRLAALADVWRAREAAVRAETLDEAADDFERWVTSAGTSSRAVERWLRDRAEAVRRGEGGR